MTALTAALADGTSAGQGPNVPSMRYPGMGTIAVTGTVKAGGRIADVRGSTCPEADERKWTV